MAGILRGSKTSGRHQTLTDHAKLIYAKLKKEEVIAKIVIGPIVPVKSGRYSVKYKLTPTGIELSVKSPREVQTLYVLGPMMDVVEQVVQQLIKS